MARLTNTKAIERDIGGLTWTSWTPTVTAAAGSFTTVTVNFAAYLKIGKMVFYEILCKCDDKGTAAHDVRFSAPSGLTTVGNSCGRGREILVTGLSIQSLVTSNLIVAWNYNNTFPLENGRQILISGWYCTS